VAASFEGLLVCACVCHECVCVWHQAVCVPTQPSHTHNSPSHASLANSPPYVQGLGNQPMQGCCQCVEAWCYGVGCACHRAESAMHHPATSAPPHHCRQLRVTCLCYLRCLGCWGSSGFAGCVLACVSVTRCPGFGDLVARARVRVRVRECVTQGGEVLGAS
jgi:hypothetical protein